MVGHF